MRINQTVRAVVGAGLISCSFLIGGLHNAYAESVTFRLAAVVEYVDDPWDIIGGNVQIGDTIEVKYTFESTVPDVNPDPNTGQYQYANVPGGFEMTVTIGPLSWQTAELNPNNISSEIRIDNDVGSAPYIRDLYRADGREATGGIGTEEFLRLRLMLLTYNNLDAFASDVLPLIPPDLALFESVNVFHIYAEGVDYYYYIEGRPTDFWLYTPNQMINDLIAEVMEINFGNNISNSFDQKLNTAVQILDDVNENNDVAAIKMLGAFIHEVEAQSGISIDPVQADELISAAQEIVDLLS